MTTDTGDTERLGPLAERPAMALAGLAGLGFGLSAFAFGFYDPLVWEPIALGALCALLALLAIRRGLPTGPGLIAVGALISIWLWSMLSSGWAESVDAAVTDANRWLLYAVVLLALLLLVRTRGTARLLLGAATAGVLVVAGYVLIKMLASDASPMFIDNRLSEPLDYVNAQATVFLLGFWPLIALAERARSAVLAGLAAAATVPLAALVVLTQSRGAFFAFAVSAIVLLAVVPGRTRRGWVLIAVGLGVLVVASPLSDFLSLHTASPALDHTLHRVAVASLLGAGLTGIVWGLASAIGARAAERSYEAHRWLPRAATIGLVVVTLIGAGIALFPAGKRIDQVRHQYHVFTSLGQTSGGSARLFSGGGKRYDFWRVAWDQFTDHPLGGVGAGNYDRTYFIERRSTSDVRQAHSIEMQALGENGIVGGAILAVFVGTVLFAFWRRSNGGPSVADPGLAAAGGGMFLAWFAQTSVDWMHLIPGLTGLALCGVIALTADFEPERPEIGGRWLSRRLVLVGVGAVIAAAAFLVARPMVASELRSDGYNELSSNPKAAIKDAQKSLALDDEPLDAYYLEAAGYARLNLYGQARAALLEATRREPHDFVTWALLGDLATRRGDRALAHRYYRRALSLNPRDTGLQMLAGKSSA